MTDTNVQPQLTKEGVAFTVRVDSLNRECLISTEALSKLAKLGNGKLDPLATFHAFEATINGVARRLVAANVPGNPLQLGPNSFQ